MIHATLLALIAAAAAAPAAKAAEAPSASVFLKASAATAGSASCRTTPVDAKLVRASLFSPDSEQCPVASIEGEPILLRDLAEALEFQHMSMSPRAPAPAKRPDMDFTPALDRIITTRLLIQEARVMGIDRRPEVANNVEDYKATRLRALLQREATKGAKPDAAEVERLYRDAVREYKLKSVLLEKEDDAKSFEAALKKGGGFDALTAKYVKEKKAKGGGKAEFVPPKHMLPEILEAVKAAKRGVPTGLVKVPSGWVVLRVDGTRYPANDVEARNQAKARSLARVEQETVRNFYLALVKKYATVDQALLKSIDFEANGEKGFEALLKDQRTLVAIKGDKPVTVGDLTREVSMKFFHGLESPIKEKRVNHQKDQAFEKLLGSRLFAKEAAERKLASRPEFRRDVEEYERAAVFNTFIEKVIAPDVKVTEADAIKYYEDHKAEFTAPQMYKLDGFAFATAKEAQAAIDKLKAGTDFPWLKQSAPGQLPADKRALQFDGNTVSASTLPQGLAKALTNARTGEYRLYSAREGEVYVVKVVDQIAPAAQPYVDAREPIAKKLFNEKLMVAMSEYAAKLRKQQRVDVLITRVSM